MIRPVMSAASDSTIGAGSSMLPESSVDDASRESIAPKKVLLVSEIYGPVVQGEGLVIGKPTLFVRFGGCDYCCQWCDSLYAVLPEYKSEWTKMTPEEIIDKLFELSGGTQILVTLSGGNPALQDLSELVRLGRRVGFSFGIETQGTKCSPWWNKLDYVCISPKPPSSGMTTNWDKLAECVAQARIIAGSYLKVVVFDEEDYDYARVIYDLHGYDLPVCLQAGTRDPYGDTDTFEGLATFRDNIAKATDWLVQRAFRDRWYNITILPQMHALLGGAKRAI